MLASPHTHRISKSVIRMFMLSFPITQHEHCITKSMYYGHVLNSTDLSNCYHYQNKYII